mgnify:CR=1 FL=1
MSASVTPTQDSIFIGLRAFVLTLITTEVIQGLGNRVATPKGSFITMTATLQNRLATNISSYNDPGIGVGTKAVMQPTKYTVQIDCYGPLSSDWATIITAMWRDTYGCEQLAPYNMQPLQADNPAQMALVDGEDEYEQRWMITAELQANPVIVVAQEFADSVKIGIVNVEATYPL